MLMLHSVKRSLLVLGSIVLLTPMSGAAFAAPTAPQTHSTTTAKTSPRSTSLVEQLNLSSQQKQKIRGIFMTRNQQIARKLSSTQRTKLQQALKSGTKLSVALKQLNLTADQKKTIGGIIQASNREIRGTLTSTQQKQLDAYLQQRRVASSQTPIE